MSLFIQAGNQHRPGPKEDEEVPASKKCRRKESGDQGIIGFAVGPKSVFYRVRWTVLWEIRYYSYGSGTLKPFRDRCESTVCGKASWRRGRHEVGTVQILLTLNPVLTTLGILIGES